MAVSLRNAQGGQQGSHLQLLVPSLASVTEPMVGSLSYGSLVSSLGRIPTERPRRPAKLASTITCSFASLSYGAFHMALATPGAPFQGARRPVFKRHINFRANHTQKPMPGNMLLFPKKTVSTSPARFIQIMPDVFRIRDSRWK